MGLIRSPKIYTQNVLKKFATKFAIKFGPDEVQSTDLQKSQ